MLWMLTFGLGISPRPAEGESAVGAAMQSPEDAWWTGPLLASASAALPAGHVLIESYVYNSTVDARFDNSGSRINVPSSEYVGLLTEVFYGVTDKLTVGVFGRLGYQHLTFAPPSSTVSIGDTTLQAQYQLHEWRPDSQLPTLAFVLSETLPSARYDQLGERLSDGMGSGTHTTTLALYSQRLFWMPSQRLLRARLNISYSLPDAVPTRDESVYGTGNGFRGLVKPGATLEIDMAQEYNISRHWVVAVDVDYLRTSSTLIHGSYARRFRANPEPTPLDSCIGSSRLLSIAPAIEYNFNADIGIIAGALLPLSGRNASASITPMLAINMFF